MPYRHWYRTYRYLCNYAPLIPAASHSGSYAKLCTAVLQFGYTTWSQNKTRPLRLAAVQRVATAPLSAGSRSGFPSCHITTTRFRNPEDSEVWESEVKPVKKRPLLNIGDWSHDHWYTSRLEHSFIHTTSTDPRFSIAFFFATNKCLTWTRTRIRFIKPRGWLGSPSNNSRPPL